MGILAICVHYPRCKIFLSNQPSQSCANEYVNRCHQLQHNRVLTSIFPVWIDRLRYASRREGMCFGIASKPRSFLQDSIVSRLLISKKIKNGMSCSQSTNSKLIYQCNKVCHYVEPWSIAISDFISSNGGNPSNVRKLRSFRKFAVVANNAGFPGTLR